MYDHNINAYIPYLFICIYLFAYTFTNTSVISAKKTNNLLTELTNKCFMNSNTYNHSNIYNKSLYSFINI